MSEQADDGNSDRVWFKNRNGDMMSFGASLPRVWVREGGDERELTEPEVRALVGAPANE